MNSSQLGRTVLIAGILSLAIALVSSLILLAFDLKWAPVFLAALTILPGLTLATFRLALHHRSPDGKSDRSFLFHYAILSVPVTMMSTLIIFVFAIGFHTLATPEGAKSVSNAAVLKAFFNPSKDTAVVVLVLAVLVSSVLTYRFVRWGNKTLSNLGLWELQPPRALLGSDDPARKVRQRGTELLSYKQIQKRSRSILPQKGESFCWGGLMLPMKLATQHFLVAGVTGSGKTLTLSSLMDSFIPSVTAGGKRRALVFDPKNEALSQIKATGGDMTLVKMLNPFDSRSSAWDMAKDLTAPGHAREFATLLFPRETKHDPFWDNAPADLLEGVILSFNHKHPRDWELRDLLLAMSNVDDLYQVLLWDLDSNEQRAKSYFGETRLQQSILATLASKASHYRVIAACWHNAKSKVSLEDWVKGDGILVFGHSDDYPDALREINRAMFRRVTQLLLREPDSEERKTFVFIDELGATGKLDLLNDLMLKGRSRGVSVAIGFQDIASLKETYGENITEAITGQVGNKAILRLHSAMTSKWAERVFGDEEFVEQMKSMQIGDDYQRGWGEHRQIQPIVRDSEFMSLPTPDRDAGRGVTGYFQVWDLGSYKTEFPIHRPESPCGIMNFEPRDPQHQRLTRWMADERSRFGLMEDSLGASSTTTSSRERLDYS